MKARDAGRSGTAVAMVFGAMICGCVELEDGEEEDVGVSGQPLYYSTSGLWRQRDVPVGWTTTGQETEKGWVRDVLRGQRSWSQQGNINFVGWGACGPNATGIRVTGGANNFSGLGQSGGAVSVTLDFTAAPQTAYTRCVTNSLNREQCIKTTALHEFGHAIGYASACATGGGSIVSTIRSMRRPRACTTTTVTGSTT
jgi:hypothetical protein